MSGSTPAWAPESSGKPRRPRAADPSTDSASGGHARTVIWVSPLQRGGTHVGGARLWQLQSALSEGEAHAVVVRAVPGNPHWTRVGTDFPRPLRKSEARLRLACPWREGRHSGDEAPESPPLERESSRMAKADRVGGRRRSHLPTAESHLRDAALAPLRLVYGVAPLSCRLPLKGGALLGGRAFGGAALISPHSRLRRRRTHTTPGCRPGLHEAAASLLDKEDL